MTTTDRAAPHDQMLLRRQAVQRQLAAVRRKMRTHLLAEGLFWAVLAIVVLASVTLLGDYLLRLSLAWRVTLGVLAGGAIVAVAVIRLVRPLALPLDELDMAAIVDRRLPGVGEKLANVLQLPQLAESDPHTSPSMVAAAVAQQAEELTACDLAKTLNRPRRAWQTTGVALLAAAVVLFVIVSPATASLWLRRWLLGSDVRWPQSTYMSLVGLGGQERLTAPRGEAVVLQIDAQPKFSGTPGQWQLSGRGAPLVVETQEAPSSKIPGQISISYRTRDSQVRQANFVHFSGANFRFELPPLVEPVEVEIRGGDDWLGPLSIEPIDRPSVKNLTLTAVQLGATAPEVHRVGEKDSQLLFLPGSKIKLTLESSEPLSAAEALRAEETAQPLVRRGERSFETQWEMKEPLTIELRLTGLVSGLTSKPYFVSVGLQNDREPRVTARSTGVGRRVTPQARIPLVLRALDDFGLDEMGTELEQTVYVDQKPMTSAKPLDAEKLSADKQGAYPLEIERSPMVALVDLGLTPGTAIKLRARATDRSVLGARKGYSRWINFQVVTPEELFYEILMRQREQRARFAAALASAKSQSETLDALTAPEQAVGLVRTHQVVVRQVWQIANQLDATLQEMTLNDLGSPQARDLLETLVIKAMRTLHDDRLARQRTQIDALAAASSPSGPPRDEAKKLQDEIVVEMQKILSQMSQWESFVDVINQLRQVIKLQGQVLDTTQEAQKSRTEDLFDK